MYRRIPASAEDLQVFLVHPGGPFFKNRDDVWGIPKGWIEENENLLEAAKREFSEETGMLLNPNTSYCELGSTTYPNGKVVYAWAFEGDLPRDYILKSNPSKFGWPENDRGEFFDLETAKLKILPAQLPFLAKLASEVHQSNHDPAI